MLCLSVYLYDDYTPDEYTITLKDTSELEPREVISGLSSRTQCLEG